MTFETDVFINCPFDTPFLPLLRPILFAVTDLGLTPRIALESMDSGRPRLEKMVALIESSKYAIHDLSRLQAQEAGEYFRLNMPLELGLDIGCRLFKPGPAATKKCLILEAERFRYQAAISDMSGSDIAVHGGEPARALTAVRNWLNTEARLRAKGAAAIWGRFTDFMTDNYVALKARGYSDENVEQLSVAELIEDMRVWVDRHQS